MSKTIDKSKLDNYNKFTLSQDIGMHKMENLCINHRC